MVIVKVMAGLGNQMFEYALFRALLAQGKDAKMDLSFFDTFRAHNGYELGKVFHITEVIASRQEAAKLGGIRHDPVSRAFRKYIFRKRSHYIQDMEDGFGFLPEVFELEDVYLQGYWQSEKYFRDIEPILRREFTFKQPLDQKNAMMAERISMSNSVSVHIRRGDYVNSPNLGGICSRQYYENAVAYIAGLVENPSYFVFSDDIAWCRENLSLKDCTYVAGNSQEDSYKDMQLMSLCRYNIIANSSFSWWGAWLNKNPQKVVMAPVKWFNNNRMNTQDLLPDSWVRIPV